MPKKTLTSDLQEGAIGRGKTPARTRRISLRKSERNALALQEIMEGAVARFLDLERDRSWPQVAEELGISLHQLKELVKTPEFVELYNTPFAELGHDPREQHRDRPQGVELPLPRVLGARGLQEAVLQGLSGG